MIAKMKSEHVSLVGEFERVQLEQAEVLAKG